MNFLILLLMMLERMILLKGVPIKFRAKALNWEMISGDLIHDSCKGTLIHKETLPIDHYTRINPVTITQLVGYDVNHNEIYEGDELVDEDGNVYRVYLTAMFIRDGKLGFNLSPATVQLHQLILKGE